MDQFPPVRPGSKQIPPVVSGQLAISFRRRTLASKLPGRGRAAAGASYSETETETETENEVEKMRKPTGNEACGGTDE